MPRTDRDRGRDPHEASGRDGDADGVDRPEPASIPEPRPDDEVDEWGYESFPASDPPQH